MKVAPEAPTFLFLHVTLSRGVGRDPAHAVKGATMDVWRAQRRKIKMENDTIESKIKLHTAVQFVNCSFATAPQVTKTGTKHEHFCVVEQTRG